jgi:hypothetical protein
MTVDISLLAKSTVLQFASLITVLLQQKVLCTVYVDIILTTDQPKGQVLLDTLATVQLPKVLKTGALRNCSGQILRLDLCRLEEELKHLRKSCLTESSSLQEGAEDVPCPADLMTLSELGLLHTKFSQCQATVDLTRKKLLPSGKSRPIDESLLGDLSGGRPGTIIEDEEELATKARMEREIIAGTRNYPKYLEDYGRCWKKMTELSTILTTRR